MTHIKTYTDKQYACKITYIITSNIEVEITKWYKRNKLKLEEFILDSEGVVLFETISHYTLIIDENCLSYNTINHELFHLTREIAVPRGIHEDESQAWIMGNVSQQLYNFINSKNLKIK